MRSLAFAFAILAACSGSSSKPAPVPIIDPLAGHWVGEAVRYWPDELAEPAELRVLSSDENHINAGFGIGNRVGIGPDSIPIDEAGRIDWQEDQGRYVLRVSLSRSEPERYVGSYEIDWLDGAVELGTVDLVRWWRPAQD